MAISKIVKEVIFIRQVQSFMVSGIEEHCGNTIEDSQLRGH